MTRGGTYDQQNLDGSFSAASKPNVASKYSKYALESSRRDLHNALLCTALVSEVAKSVVHSSVNPNIFFKKLPNDF